MLKRRIACILLIISALILYLFDNETVTLALLLAFIVMPAVSVGLLALSGRNFRISMERAAQSGENPVVRVRIENPDIIPLAAVEAEVVCTNLRTGEADSYIIRNTPRPKSTQEIDLEVMPKNAGRYEIAVSSAVLTDPLQLSSRQIVCQDIEYVTVMPEQFDMQVSYASDAAMLESDRSSDSRRGNDPGEVRAIREYVPGDPVRNIHWKLSEKTDKLLVKELGSPITDQFLVILDTAHEVSQIPAALETIASVFVSLAETIRQYSSGLSIGWTDPDTGRAVIRKIKEKNDITAAADEYLAMPAAMHSAFERIERDIAESRYAHIVFVGSMIPDGIEAIANGCQVTVLLYGDTGAVTENNVTTVGFDADSYKSDLAGIEI
ncbi:MAG: DUF58 domain-containing protein [Mogibacterium sp.]|nr:DUF58 domain-containing protein [Mogibacterium sp.]